MCTVGQYFVDDRHVSTAAVPVLQLFPLFVPARQPPLFLYGFNKYATEWHILTINSVDLNDLPGFQVGLNDYMFVFLFLRVAELIQVEMGSTAFPFLAFKIFTSMSSTS